MVRARSGFMHAKAPPMSSASSPNIAAFPLLLPVKASVPRGKARRMTMTRRGKRGKRSTMITRVGPVGGGPPRFVTGTVFGGWLVFGTVLCGFVFGGLVFGGLLTVVVTFGVSSWKL